MRYVLSHAEARKRASEAVLVAPAGHIVTISEPKRSLIANARMWAMLNEIASQVVWHGQKLSAEDFKVMATAAIRKQRVVPGIDGGFVVLGDSTSKMSISQMSELITFLEAFGAEHGVKFSDRSWE